MSKRLEIERQTIMAEDIRNLRKSTGMNRREFCIFFGVPYDTVTQWELGCASMPDYLFRLIEYKARMENLIKNPS